MSLKTEGPITVHSAPITSPTINGTNTMYDKIINHNFSQLTNLIPKTKNYLINIICVYFSNIYYST